MRIKKKLKTFKRCRIISNSTVNGSHKDMRDRTGQKKELQETMVKNFPNIIKYMKLQIPEP